MIKINILIKISIFILLNLIPTIWAVDVDTVTIYSEAMHKSPKAVIVLPNHYNSDNMDAFPVVYLLHGWSGNYSNWINKADLQTLVDKYNIIIVCPDGGYAGWYR